MPNSRIPSPARSQSGLVTPRRHKPRGPRSVGSPARSNTSTRLTLVIRDFKENNMDSFRLSPLNSRHSVLNDNTDIEDPKRNSWWKKLNDTSRDIMEVLDSDKQGAYNVIEEYMDVDVPSQEKKNNTIEKAVCDSSDSESISSIVVPQRQLFTQKENNPKNKFAQLIVSRESMAKFKKTNVGADKSDNFDKTIVGGTKKLFGQSSKPRSKPAFPTELLTFSPDKTVNKTAGEVKGQVRNLFGNRAGVKRKNKFADFIASESEEEPEIQAKVFGFKKKSDIYSRRVSTASQGIQEPSPTSSFIDIHMDDWKLLPSSTMVQTQLEAMLTDSPVKKARMESENLGKNIADDNQVDSEGVCQEIIDKNVNSGNEKFVIKTIERNNSNKKSCNIQNESQAIDDKKHGSEINEEKDKLESEQIYAESASQINRTKNQDIKIDGPAQMGTCEQSTYGRENKSIRVEVSIPVVAKCKDNSAVDVKTKNKNVDTDVPTDKGADEVNQDIKIDDPAEAEDEEGIEGEENKSQYVETHSSAIADNEEEEENEGRQVETSVPAEADNDDSEEGVLDEKLEMESDDPSEAGDNQELEIDEPAEPEHNEDEQNDDQEIGMDELEHGEEGEENELNQVEIDEPAKPEHGKGDDENELQEVKIDEPSVSEHDDEDEVNEDQEMGDLAETDEVAAVEENEIEIDDLENKNQNNEESLVDQENESQEIEDLNKEIGNESHLISNQEKKEESEAEKNDISEAEVENEVSEAEEENEVSEAKEDNEVSEAEEENEESEAEEENEESEVEVENEVLEAEEDNEESEAEVENVLSEAEEVNEESEAEVENVLSEAEEENEESEAEVENVLSEAEEENEESEAEEGNKESEVEEENEVSEAEEENESQDIMNDSDANQDKSNVVINESEELDNEEFGLSGAQGETPNLTHDTTGRNRRKDETNLKSPEVILQNNIDQMESFTAKGHNTSIRKTDLMKTLNIRPSLAPPRDSTGFSDGTKNSSAEGSGWDSHRTTRKTLRQTFGKDFTPRKSLRALVMEKSAKRHTVYNDINDVDMPRANSTELPETSNRDYEEEDAHEISRRTRQTTLEMYLQKIKKQNIEKRMKLEEEVRNSLKAPTRGISNPFKMPSRPFSLKRTTKPVQTKPKSKTIKSMIPLELPQEILEDMKYKPPKRFQPSNASWITKRLYKFLESKLESKYDYKARIRAEKLVETIYNFVKDQRRHYVAASDAVEVLKHEMARLGIVNTHFEFYQFFHDFMPREICVKVVPDIINKIPQPRHGVFTDILRGNTVHE